MYLTIKLLEHALILNDLIIDIFVERIYFLILKALKYGNFEILIIFV